MFGGYHGSRGGKTNGSEGHNEDDIPLFCPTVGHVIVPVDHVMSCDLKFSFSLWESAVQCLATLDALMSLAAYRSVKFYCEDFGVPEIFVSQKCLVL